MATRTAEQNAVEFGALSKQGKDVRLALLAACSVEPGAGQERRRSDRSDAGKVSASVFADRADSTQSRVMRHLRAWDKFAKATGLPKAAALKPADAVTLVITEAQAAQFDTISLDSKGGAAHGLTQKAADIRANKAAMTEAIVNDPEVAAAAAAALVTTDAGRQAMTTVAREQVQKEVRERFPKPAAPAQPIKSSAGTNPNPGGLVGMIDLLTVSELVTRVSIALTNVAKVLPNASEEAREHVIAYIDEVWPEQVAQLREQAIGMANISPEDFG